jgi:hypothetical protein
MDRSLMHWHMIEKQRKGVISTLVVQKLAID